MTSTGKQGHGGDALGTPASAIDPTRTSEPSVHGDAPSPPDADMSPVAPVHRDPRRYELLGEHGRGGLGRVSRAHDRELGRDVAIKELISRGDIREVRFLREALITARLEHPGIVPVHEAGRWLDGTPFYVMKLVAGRSLRELIAERHTVEERLGLLHHVIAVADAIAYAHGRNIIHRDLKPANVIVGDFGETVVIDWGLAKDLTSAELDRGGGPFRSLAGSELTEAGAVLGTPAYMAPEQQRGEPVDQRADVFAIGAMLWELCALNQLPRRDRARHRVLRRAGIDRDLVAIIDKAVASDPERRYRDAGALAADLKAFTSGARIAARSYSLFAMLAHWTRRHRAASRTAAGVMVLLLAGALAYVRSVATERDRADAAAADARRQRLEAEHARDEVILQHAQLLLHSDPTLALEHLASYRGRDPAAALVEARARALGVAHMTATPHTGRVVLAHGGPDGVLTVGDQTIATTSMTAHSRIIARNVTTQQAAAYAASRHLLAYACDPGGTCLVDIATEQPRATPPEMASFAAETLAFSPDGALLAAISAHGAIAIWSIPDRALPALRYRAAVDSGHDIFFVGSDRIAVTTNRRIQVFHLDDGSLVSRQRLVLTGAISAAADSTGAHVVAATRSVLHVLNLATGAMRSSATVCKGAVNSVAFVPRGQLIAYGCQDGDAGIWDAERNMATVVGHVDSGVNLVAVSGDGRYLVIGGIGGVLLVYDVDGDLLSTYRGHTAAISALVPPSREVPYITAGDTSGAVRVWPVPLPAARTVIRSATRLISTVLVSSDGPVIGTGVDAALRWASLDGHSGELPGHAHTHLGITMSRAAPQFAMYLFDPVIELWSFAGRPALQLVKTDHDSVTAVQFLGDGRSFVSAGRDGRVLRWAPDASSHRELGRIPEAIEFLAVQPRTDVLVIQGASGRLWLLDDGRVAPLTGDGTHVARYRFSRDDQWLAVATTEGGLDLYDARTWRVRGHQVLETGIHDMDFSVTGDRLAITTKSRVHLLDTRPLPDGALAHAGGSSWSTLDLRARAIGFSADGAWLGMIGEDGALWFYATERQRWSCVATPGKVSFGYFARDGRYFVATDPEGRGLLIDMATVQRARPDSMEHHERGLL